MNILNLADADQSDIAYKVTHFPDGQQDILLINPEIMKQVTILSRFNSFQDLELILAATAALRRIDVAEIRLYIPYLLGSRSDRQFQKNGTSYLVDVIAPILNAQDYKSIEVLDVHSDVAFACIRNLRSGSNASLLTQAISRFKLKSDFLLVSPDAGALKKIYALSETIDYERDILVCSKHRDVRTGKILSTEVPLKRSQWLTDLVIVDDIIDGGRTFIELAKAARKAGHQGFIYLIVSHGIFSAGFKELMTHLDGILTTNSIRNLDLREAIGRDAPNFMFHQTNLFL